MSLKRTWPVGVTVAAAALAATLVGVPALATPNGNGGHASDVEEIAPGIELSTFDTDTSHGDVRALVLKADLSHEGVKAGTLYPGNVAETKELTSQADQAEAVAGINGDFFNWERDVAPATSSAVGPMVSGGKVYKSAVPGAQRSGPPLPDGASNADVMGITSDGEAAISTLKFKGSAAGPDGSVTLRGLNQYAIPVGGVGLFNSDWGSKPRKRATCGTEEDHGAGCADKTKEVTLTDGKVTAISDTPGDGEIAKNQQVLLAREDDGVKQLDGLSEGDDVKVDYSLDGPEFEEAVSGIPILKDSKPLDNLNDSDLVPRTAAGISADGKTLYMAVVDVKDGVSIGATIKSMSEVMGNLGADDAVNFDGGGSTELVARKAGEDTVSVRNRPATGEERPVTNGLGLFAS